MNLQEALKIRAVVSFFLISFFLSTPLAAQELCKVTWLSPSNVGEPATIQPGEYIGAWFKSFQGGRVGVHAFRVSVKFRGRTGEKTFDLEIIHWTSGEEESTEIRKYFLFPSDILNINLIRFQVVALNGSFLRFVMLGHPKPKEMSPCPEVLNDKLAQIAKLEAS